ncbi:hypothetical protein [Corynebacterium glyciniphilum]|uniref:hypothetical protein n=1 Tax=Corynebacterium glyciniphilum TaxID=1404244 RepID=UPI003FD22C8F
MTTPDELRTMLQSLAEYCALIEQDLQDSAYPAAASSNAGARPIGPKGKPPCSIVDLDFIIEDVSPIIRGWATALQKDAHRTGLPIDRPLNEWCAWLSRYRESLLAMPWADTAVEELDKLASQLHDRLHPPDPKQQAAMAAIAGDRKGTAREIATLLTALGEEKVDRLKVAYLGKSGRIRQYEGPDGETHYSLVEAREALDEWVDGRVKNTL